MVVVFDLDDTLYNEITYVESGFDAVAKFISENTEAKQTVILSKMMQNLQLNGRGKVFNDILKEFNLYSKSNVKKSISIYRLHQPNIKLDKEVLELLKEFNIKYPLYLVTDGNKVVQSLKVKALTIEAFFKKVFVTHRYGLKASKPSLFCFERIKSLEKCNWDDMIYIGDNPKKDFVNLNKMRAYTVRIIQGDHKDLKLDSAHEAHYSISNLQELRELIPSIEMIKK